MQVTLQLFCFFNKFIYYLFIYFWLRQGLRCMWDLPRQGLEPVSPALAGGFLTTAPPGKSLSTCFNRRYFSSKFLRGILFFKILFIYLFMAVLGLRFCAGAFSSCGKRGPLTIAGSLVVEHRLQTRKLSNCGSRAQLLCGMWNLPRPGLEPVSPALAGKFSTTAPPGQPFRGILEKNIS